MAAGLLSNRVDREDLVAGDHIYSWRAAYLYAHHGDEMVIHFTRAAGHEIGTGTFLDSFLFSSSTSSAAAGDPPCQRQRCGHLVRPDDGVVMSCLDCFFGSSPRRRLAVSLALFHYAVSPALFLAKARGGTWRPAPWQWAKSPRPMRPNFHNHPTHRPSSGGVKQAEQQRS
ncbi:hypothetical protein SEVIR_2G457550v4 [Setaria viridis]